ncbi:MAG TPA: TonB-dependent receptor plug domain-containing protein, partial [Thermoanaerobaculia bacterium]|nr:TonB-dependent receptor plug domain-containing protein [Thermoanaerobaculia bacterium]
MKGRSRVPVLLVGLAFAPGPAWPQTALPPEQAAAVEEAEAAVSEMPKVLDQIVVTARQREEDLQEVPMAVTALNSTQVEEARIESPEDFVALVPNLSMASSFTVGNSLLTMRGISQINNSDPPVAVVVDGVYQGNQKQFVQELFDIERIEVMRGPQGALYGRNSLGGAINIITRQPGNDFRGSVRASAGNGSALGLMASVSGALVKDVLQMSLAGSYKESDGLRENVYLHRKADPYEDAAARLQLRWLPVERSWLDLRIATATTEGGAVAYSIFPTVRLANDFRYDPDESILGFSRRDMDDLSLRFVREGGSWVFTSITGATELAESYRGDGDFSNPAREDLVFPFGQLGQGQHLDVRLLSQELRLTSAGGGDFEWLAGAYVQETDRRLDSFAFFDTNGTVAGFVPFITVSEGNDNTANALFGRLGGRLGGRWGGAVGLRFDRDRRRQKDLGSGRERD